ncbi:hypothetical protein IQ238_08280 [Pleurocapsales cyanobacterium LEGE 06147]|nr:hypothetical protein [Pleurocapsales cyanobacterium LEGE 06147]
MIVFVIVVNLCITVVNFYLAVKIWQLRRWLICATKTLIDCEYSIQTLFYSGQTILDRKQKNINQLRQRYQILQLQWQRIRQILFLLNLTVRLWRKF